MRKALNMCSQKAYDVWGHRNTAGTALGSSLQINLFQAAGLCSTALLQCVMEKKNGLLDS